MEKILKRLQTLRKNKEQGFSLLEMLIVLIVVALLMVILIPNISSQRDRIDEQGKANITEIVHSQAQAYQMVEGAGPVSLDTLVSSGYLTDKQADEAVKRMDGINSRADTVQ
ncbi:prepilin-type cleavage/methylation domain-containing protein [Suicoccus acidiformans]|uniref:Prepilin-type cleavage/methylation domain-containing protein n=1 Tax=Suicoccus acidiformans TaxID=2036206 RepID=A0A347WJC4_9LACT|nr:competence type IV pilus major pilin ComGC [Suicoccus acidiformans]AXY25181.1 prepilin-type cleavage/methylation domain-containing protein [Suicoccus acidiformans]